MHLRVINANMKSMRKNRDKSPILMPSSASSAKHNKTGLFRNLTQKRIGLIKTKKDISPVSSNIIINLNHIVKAADFYSYVTNQNPSELQALTYEISQNTERDNSSPSDVFAGSCSLH